ncbi:uncharacterized protein CDAR_413971 [Caerostris darwini]|uniref:Uncharacterized protein n=2 Tax=Caerostris TaxID=172845 RepID=A0AAV4RE30_9ARAC|nr:uncharacterized protein CDAR_413971 [Caerostris darwini]GIY36026.1 uncharacterized protein CEXT_464391 [Caerostris extrusa]
MEYPSRKKPIFKRSRKVPFSYRYPRTFFWGIIGTSMLLFFSRPIYDIIFRPPTVDPYAIDDETRKKIADRTRRIKSIF